MPNWDSDSWPVAGAANKTTGRPYSARLRFMMASVQATTDDPRECLAHRRAAEKRRVFLTWLGALSVHDMASVNGRLQAGEDSDAIREEMNHDA